MPTSLKKHFFTSANRQVQQHCPECGALAIYFQKHMHRIRANKQTVQCSYTIPRGGPPRGSARLQFTDECCKVRMPTKCGNAMYSLNETVSACFYMSKVICYVSRICPYDIFGILQSADRKHNISIRRLLPSLEDFEKLSLKL